MNEARVIEILKSPDLIREPLHTAIATEGQLLLNFDAQLDRLHFRPNAAITAGYAVTYQVGASGDTVTDYLVLATGDWREKAQRAGTPLAYVQRDEIGLSIWRHPDDPELPGLRGACTPATVAEWLSDCGIETNETLQPEILVYRPTRRAVIRATWRDPEPHAVYLKVVPERKATKIVQRHKLASAIGPKLLAQPVQGVVITAENSGAPLSERYSQFSREGAPLPTLREVEALLDALPSETAAIESRPSWTDSIATYKRSAVQELPSEGRRIAELCAKVKEFAHAGTEPPTVPTHGDFYEANIFASAAGKPTSVIDIDNLGPGHREDDLACLLGHMAVLPSLSPAHYENLGPAIEEWYWDACERHSPVRLAARIAGVVISLISGAHGENARAWLEVAEQWAARAELAATKNCLSPQVRLEENDAQVSTKEVL